MDCPGCVPIHMLCIVPFHPGLGLRKRGSDSFHKRSRFAVLSFTFNFCNSLNNSFEASSHGPLYGRIATRPDFDISSEVTSLHGITVLVFVAGVIEATIPIP